MITFSNKKHFQKALSSLSTDLHSAAVDGLHLSLDDWLRRARNDSPKDLGFLRSEMKTQIATDILEGVLHSNAYSKGFNYAYYLHEVGSKKGYQARNGKSITWIKDTQDPKRSWGIVEKEIRTQMRAKGW